MTVRLARIGWSNLWRNPRRTLITIAALTLGMIMLAVTLSLMTGMNRDLIEQGTSLLLGHVQIHARSYRPDRSIFDTIPGNGPALAARIRQQAGVLGASPRVNAYGLVSAGEHSAGADLLGVIPELESEVSILGNHVVAGTSLQVSAATGRREVLVGERLAHTLGVGPNDELVILTQAVDGSLGNDLYRVAGLLQTQIEAVDGGLVMMRLDDLQELLGLDQTRIHEIAIRGINPAGAVELAARLRRDLNLDNLEVAAWPALAPEIAAYVAMSDGWTWIMYAIVLSLAAIAVLNTMLMAVFERFREFGVLAAVGMRPLQIVFLVIAEGAALGVVSLALSVCAGAPLIHWLVVRGIDLSAITGGFTMSGVAIGPVLRGAWAGGKFLASAGLLIAFSLLAGLYPAARAARVNPARLTRGELR